jgi:hypothetical protein
MVPLVYIYLLDQLLGQSEGFSSGDGISIGDAVFRSG